MERELLECKEADRNDILDCRTLEPNQDNIRMQAFADSSAISSQYYITKNL